MSAEIRDELFRTVVGGEVAVELVAGGFSFTEGPIWHPRERHLTFSDMPGNEMRRWTPAGGVVSFRKPSNMANGNTYDRRGRMLTCEHATSRVTRTDADGTVKVLATHYQGKELNSPNDIVVKSDGWIYFTDPTYGRMPYYGVERASELDFRGVYRVAEDGTGLTLLADDFVQPNGLCFSRDERRLFVNDTERGHVRVFDVGADGLLSGGAVWAEVRGSGQGAPDGMKIDRDGNLYCCGPGGLHVFCAGRAVARRDPRAGGSREFHLGRGRDENDLSHRFLVALSRPNKHARHAAFLISIRRESVETDGGTELVMVVARWPRKHVVETALPAGRRNIRSPGGANGCCAGKCCDKSAAAMGAVGPADNLSRSRRDHRRSVIREAGGRADVDPPPVDRGAMGRGTGMVRPGSIPGVQRRPHRHPVPVSLGYGRGFGIPQAVLP